MNLTETNPDYISLILINASDALKNDGDAIRGLSNKKDGRKIPVVVVIYDNSNDEKIRSIETGAVDYICSPINANITKNRLDNVINLYNSSEMCRRITKDPLTNAYTKEFFFEYMTQRLKSDSEHSYDLVCLEIESYTLIKGRYGKETCDSYISTMVKGLASIFPPEVMMGRIDDSHIVILMHHIPFVLHKKMMDNCMLISSASPFPAVMINAGVCSDITSDIPAEDVYNNCLIVIDSIRYKFDIYIAEYDDEIKQKVQYLKLIEANMFTALKEKQFKVYYQPKYNLEGNKKIGAEALVRWIHPEFGFMNPGEFIPLFEKNGFIFELDKYIINAVCSDIKRWIEIGKEVVPISINVSQTDFDQFRLDDTFEKIIDKYNIPHEYIHFEITESAEAPDAFRKSIAISGFKERGFNIELDDFGTGYSTLSILKEMPVDVMKIDMSLIQNVDDPSYKAILEASLFTAVKLNLKVVVEGVENIEQYEELKKLCADNIKPDIQGYYFSKPIPSDTFEKELLEKKYSC